MINLNDITVKHFLDIFEKHAQSNSTQVLTEGFSTYVAIYVFPSDVPMFSSSNLSRKNRKNMYRFLGKKNDDSGGGRFTKTVMRYGRDLRPGVFEIKCGDLSDVCSFVLSLLVSISFILKDERYLKIQKEFNICLDKLFSCDEVLCIYDATAIAMGPVRLHQVDVFYKKHLQS